NLVVLSAAELFGRFAAHLRRRLRRAERHRTQIDFSELAEGDLVVHVEHGIGRFLGLIRLAKSPHAVEAGVSPASSKSTADTAVTTEDGAQEVLALEFANEAKVYVPLEQAYLVSRYVGVGKKSPQLSSLGDAKWMRAKKNAVASIFDYAGKMLALQAERQTHPGHPFAPDTGWQAEFEDSFPFRETPDQMKAIIDTKIDMERPQPMDRLISGDVVFKDLGLVVIDEEQRFGVLHKEKFKELFKLVDLLTLSATPIPRTLYLSLVGVKDMSTIETPPLNRLPVETVVSAYDERI